MLKVNKKAVVEGKKTNNSHVIVLVQVRRYKEHLL